MKSHDALAPEHLEQTVNGELPGIGSITRNVMPRHAPRVGRYLIYGLIDPQDHCLRYVGKTHKRRELRLAEHMMRATEGDNAPVYDWIRRLQSKRLIPGIFVLERTSAAADWRLAERHWIARCRVWPASDLPYLHPPQTPKSVPVLIIRVHLLNVRDGG